MKPSVSPCLSLTLSATFHAATSALFVDWNPDVIGDFFSPEYVVHGTGRDAQGHEAVKHFLSLLLQAFPDIQVDVEILQVGEDRISWQRTFRAVHAGKFLGFPATGKAMVWRDAGTSRFHQGLIVEEWVVTDLAERFLLAKKKAG